MCSCQIGVKRCTNSTWTVIVGGFEAGIGAAAVGVAGAIGVTAAIGDAEEKKPKKHLFGGIFRKSSQADIEVSMCIVFACTGCSLTFRTLAQEVK